MDEERKTLNVFGDTKSAVVRIKEEYEFKSEDQVIKYLCKMFLESGEARAIEGYLDSKK